MDFETAQCAMRNLNNTDFNGRPLRVGVAAGDQTKEEVKVGPLVPGQTEVCSFYIYLFHFQNFALCHNIVVMKYNSLNLKVRTKNTVFIK